MNYVWKTLNDENGMETFQMKSSKGYPKLYKFFVGRGNNCEAIKSIMNKRPWWNHHTKRDLYELNFLWTQWKVNSEIDKLPSKVPKSEEIKHIGSSSEEEEEIDVPKNMLSSKY